MDMIDRIEHQGKFLHACSLPGETRADGAYPAHPNGIQLSRNRWLLLYSTRGSRGIDDEWSIIYQVRRDSIDGEILKEGWLARTCNDWDPLNDGKRYVKQHGHPVAFGVPVGALIRGRRVPHENHFVACWRTEARWINPETKFMADVEENPKLAADTRAVEWTQFRLNASDDDIEIIQSPRPLRQSGYELGDAFCEHAGLKWMIQSFVCPIPLNDDCSQWIGMNSVNGQREEIRSSGLVAMRFAYIAGRGRYEWVQTGPPIGEELFEPSVVRYRDSFVVAARRMRGKTVAWMRSDDLFSQPLPEVVCPQDQPNWFPLTAYACPDGVVRRLGGCIERSPYQGGRDPIYVVDIDPDRSFRATQVHEIYDGRKAGLPMQGGPLVDFPKLIPHPGGRSQILLHRVRSQMLNDPRRPDRQLTAEEIDASGIYWATIHYNEALPPAWVFASEAT